MVAVDDELPHEKRKSSYSIAETAVRSVILTLMIRSENASNDLLKKGTCLYIYTQTHIYVRARARAHTLIRNQ